MVTGGIRGTGIFWIFSFPLLSFFLRNSRVAALWNILFMGVLFSLLFLSSSGYRVTPYTRIDLLQAIVVYVTFMLLVYIYSSVMKSYLDKVYNTAVRDPLTGLYNRTFAFAYLKQELEKVKREELGNLCIVYIDLDNFKCINDTQGHSAGDLALREIAQLIRRNLHRKVVTARIGGDEFLIIIPRCEKRRVEKKLEELKAKIEEKFKDFKVSISYGIAVAPSDSTNIEKIIKIADSRMYSIKKEKKAKIPTVAS
jgi:diguanylate cyclase (GGDEF)-like protein